MAFHLSTSVRDLGFLEKMDGNDALGSSKFGTYLLNLVRSVSNFFESLHRSNANLMHVVDGESFHHVYRELTEGRLSMVMLLNKSSANRLICAQIKVFHLLICHSSMPHPFLAALVTAKI